MSTNNAVEFMALGDWGANTKHQSKIAKQMAKVCNASKSGTIFVAALGDNFYNEGVTSVDDPKWNEIFCDVYADVQCPWYPILGNHDWQGNVQAQLDYRNDKRWQMEALYYTKVIGNVQFFFLDTTTLCPEISQMYTDRTFSEDDESTQLEWLDRELSHSTAEWKLVFGHYPIYSGGENGSSHEMQAVEMMMYKHRVNAYFCGHDHSLQHLYNRNTRIHYFVSGSGSSTAYVRNIPNFTLSAILKPGFIHCTIVPGGGRGRLHMESTMEVRFVGDAGETLLRIKLERQP